MQANDQRCRSTLRALEMMLGIALVALLGPTAASATEIGPQLVGSYSSPATLTPPAPQLSIAVDNGRASAAVGDISTYTVTVRNLGTTQVAGLQVTQSVPTGLNFKSADSGGIAKAGTVSWRLNLKATSKATLHTTMSVSTTPKELLRLASVACASASTKGPPIVCATDSDQLPAGAAAQVSKANAALGSRPIVTSTSRNWWYAAGRLGGLVLVMGAFVALSLRRRRARDDRKQAEGFTRQADA
jgi:uncharacterized repeat protein (TIGR01451 family)